MQQDCSWFSVFTCFFVCVLQAGQSTYPITSSSWGSCGLMWSLAETHRLILSSISHRYSWCMSVIIRFSSPVTFSIWWCCIQIRWVTVLLVITSSDVTDKKVVQLQVDPNLLKGQILFCLSGATQVPQRLSCLYQRGNGQHRNSALQDKSQQWQEPISNDSQDAEGAGTCWPTEGYVWKWLEKGIFSQRDFTDGAVWNVICLHELFP